MALTEHNNISIAQIVLYLPALAVAIFLCVRHGFGRNAGWFFLIIFSIARILGAALQLATISDPRNESLYFGALTLQNIGLSPLILTQLALINRALDSVDKARNVIINPRILRLVQLVVLVGLILGAVGGSNSGSDYADTGVYMVSDLTQAGVALTIVGFGLLVIATVVVGMHISAAEPGEKRVILAVALCLPFLLVRIIYSAESAFGNNPAFSQITGDVNILLGTAVIEEIIIVFIDEAIGLTLNVRPKTGASAGYQSGIAGHLGGRFGRRDDGYEMRGLRHDRQSGSSGV
ncbi:hypothetical protein F5Y19DRAFT_411018 [Xylariaceae sp. FL1651]|nr:hypothetical protein F5Y19DRAFT_411018 [Xylariaceae sp. FL1651]